MMMLLCVGLSDGVVSECRTEGMTLGVVSECRTEGMTLGWCRNVGMSDAEYDSMTLANGLPLQKSVGQLSDECRTVGMSDCRTVSECRNSVGIVSDSSVGMSDRGSAFTILRSSS